MHACQKRHVCLGSKPCLSCVMTSKTAAIHVRCQHSMCNFLSCKILQGPHPTAWDQEGLPFSLPDAYWSIKESHTRTFYHAPSYAPSKQMYHPFTCHAPFNNLVLFPCRLFFWNKTTMHLPFTYAMHTLYRVTYMIDLSFLYYGLAKLQIVYMWRINTTPLPRQHTRMLLISHFCSGVGVIGIPLILSSHHHCPISTQYLLD